MKTMLQMFIEEMEPARELYTREILDFAKNYDFLGEMTLTERPDIDTLDYIFRFEKLDEVSEETLDRTLTELYNHMDEFSKAKGIEEFADNAVISFNKVIVMYP